MNNNTAKRRIKKWRKKQNLKALNKALYKEEYEAHLIDIAEGIGRIGGSKAKGILNNAYHSDNYNVFQASLYGIKCINWSNMRADYLYKFMDDLNENEHKKQKIVIEYYGKLGDERLSGYLVSMIGKGQHLDEVSNAICQIEKDDALNKIESILYKSKTSKEENADRHALDVLYKIGGEDAEQIIFKALAHNNPDTRVYAAQMSSLIEDKSLKDKIKGTDNDYLFLINSPKSNLFIKTLKRGFDNSEANEMSKIIDTLIKIQENAAIETLSESLKINSPMYRIEYSLNKLMDLEQYEAIKPISYVLTRCCESDFNTIVSLIRNRDKNLAVETIMGMRYDRSSSNVIDRSKYRRRFLSLNTLGDIGTDRAIKYIIKAFESAGNSKLYGRYANIAGERFGVCLQILDNNGSRDALSAIFTYAVESRYDANLIDIADKHRNEETVYALIKAANTKYIVKVYDKIKSFGSLAINPLLNSIICPEGGYGANIEKYRANAYNLLTEIGNTEYLSLLTGEEKDILTLAKTKEERFLPQLIKLLDCYPNNHDKSILAESISIYGIDIIEKIFSMRYIGDDYYDTINMVIERLIKEDREGVMNILKSLFSTKKNPNVKRAVIIALCNIADEQEISFIENNIDLNDEDMCIALIEGIKQRGSQSNVKILINMLKSEKENIRSAAIGALINIGGDEAYSIIQSLLKGDNKTDKNVAVRALLEKGDKSAAKNIVTILKDLKDENKIKAIEILGESNDIVFLDILLNQLNSSNKAIRIEAARSLIKLSKHNGRDIINKTEINKINNIHIDETKWIIPSCASEKYTKHTDYKLNY